MERYVLEYCQHDRDVECALLRFAPIAGPTSDEPLMRYLRRPPCPVFLGFDPLFQLLHEEDAADAVIHALGSGLRGPVNICPDGVAPLLQILRRLGRDHFSVPHPLVGVGERLFPRLRALPLDSGMLRHTLGGDNARMKDELGFAPKRTTAETLDDLQGRI